MKSNRFIQYIYEMYCIKRSFYKFTYIKPDNKQNYHLNQKIFLNTKNKLLFFLFTIGS